VRRSIEIKMSLLLEYIENNPKKLSA